MQMTLVPGYKDLFGPSPLTYAEWLQCLPASLGALIAITLNRELDLSRNNDQVQADLMDKICHRFTQEQKKQIFDAFQRYRQRTQGKYKNNLFERWYLLEMVVRELNRNVVISSPADEPQQEYNFLMAYTTVIDEVHRQQDIANQAAAASLKDDLFIYRMTWTGLLYQFQFQERPDPAYEFYKLASILVYAKDNYRDALRQFLHAMGVKTIAQLMGSFLQVVKSAIEPGEDEFFKSLKYFAPLSGVDDNHLRALAVNLNIFGNAHTADLRKYPLFYNPGKGFLVMDEGFFFKKIYRGSQFDLRTNSALKDIRGDDYISTIAGNVLEKKCFHDILSNMPRHKLSQLRFDDGTDNSPDAFYQYKSSILLEFKGNMFPDRLLENPNFDDFKNYLDERLIKNEKGKRKGISQLALQIDMMAQGTASWNTIVKCDHNKKKHPIYPVLCCDDFYFTMPGVNKYLDHAFQNLITERAKETYHIMPLTMLNLDIFFYIAVRKISFEQLEKLIVRYHHIVAGRVNKYQKTHLPGDLLASIPSFDEIFHTIMVVELVGKKPPDYMDLMSLGKIFQHELDEEI